MKFLLEDFPEDYTCMVCENIEEADEFCAFLDKNGRRWKNGVRYTRDTHFYPGPTAYFFNQGLHSDTIPCSVNATVLSIRGWHLNGKVLYFSDFEWSDDPAVPPMTYDELFE